MCEVTASDWPNKRHWLRDLTSRYRWCDACKSACGGWSARGGQWWWWWEGTHVS